MGEKGYRVFVSHASDDLWVAERIAEKIEAVGAGVFLDERDVAVGDNFKKRIREAIRTCRELVILYTPWSRTRNWISHELGMADQLELRIVCVFYHVAIEDFDRDGGGRGLLDDTNIVEINELGTYFAELKTRIAEV